MYVGIGFILSQATKTLGRVEVLLYSIFDLGSRRGEGSASRPGHTLLPGKTRYPLYRRLSVPQGRSGQVRKILPPPGFDPRTVQPVGSRYATRNMYVPPFYSGTVGPDGLIDVATSIAVWMTEDSFFELRLRNFCLFQSVHTGSGTQKTFHITATWIALPGAKATVA
jgi:hypothetical protein